MADIGRAAQPGYFDEVYARSDDPWGLEQRFYERRKRAVLLAALPRPEFARAYEPGCAGGVLTAELARRSREVVATDVATRAVELARARTQHLDNVDVRQERFPQQRPDGSFDLVVVSEVGYYVSDLDDLVASVDALLTEDGVLVGCHWRHGAPDHPQTADAVHAALGSGRHALVRHEEADFLLHVWTTGRTSVADADGILTT